MKVQPVGFAQQVGCGVRKNRFLVTPQTGLTISSGKRLRGGEWPQRVDQDLNVIHIQKPARHPSGHITSATRHSRLVSSGKR